MLTKITHGMEKTPSSSFHMVQHKAVALPVFFGPRSVLGRQGTNNSRAVKKDNQTTSKIKPNKSWILEAYFSKLNVYSANRNKHKATTQPLVVIITCNDCMLCLLTGMVRDLR